MNRFVTHYRRLRDAFPPRSPAAKAALANYRGRIRAMKRELLVTDRKVQVEELNAAVHLAKAAMAEYLQCWYSESQGGP